MDAAPAATGPDAGAGDHLHARRPASLVLTDLLAIGPDNGGHRLGTDVPHLLVRRVACTAGSVEVEVVLRAAAGVRPGRAPAVAGRRRRHRPRRRGVAGADQPVGLDLDRVDGVRRDDAARGPDAAFRAAPLDAGADPGPRLVAGRARATGSTTPSRPGSRGRTCTRPTTGRGRIWCTTAAGCCRGCPSSRAARSSPPRPPRCPRASAANATGTTATPGSATPASPWRRCGWPPARTRPSDFFAFMTTAAASGVGPRHGLQIMFGVGGEHDLTERELPHLAGLAGQPPGPGRQRRLEPAADRRVRRAARRRAPAGRPARQRSTSDTRRFLIACADTAAVRWRREGPGHLGGPRRPAALPVLQGDVLGGAGPGDRARRPARAPATASTGGSAAGTRSGRPSSATAGATRPARSPSTSARRRWTRRT